MSSIRNHYVKYSAHLENINEMASSEPRGLVADVEAAYRETILEIAKQIHVCGCRIIMLAGPSSSGKTTTSHILTRYLGEMGVRSVTISLDDFFLGAGNAPVLPSGRYDYESIEALDLPLMESCLEDLIFRNRCLMPTFNFEKSRREEAFREVELAPHDVVVVEGIHALNPRVSKGLPEDKIFKIYISVKQGISNLHGEVISARELRFIRRLVRDYNFRSSSPENTLTMWKDVCRGEDIYIQPYKRGADVTINSIHLYEPCVFKAMALPLLRQVGRGHESYAMVERLAQALEQFVSISPELIPNDSLMMEFVKR